MNDMNEKESDAFSNLALTFMLAMMRGEDNKPVVLSLPKKLLRMWSDWIDDHNIRMVVVDDDDMIRICLMTPVNDEFTQVTPEYVLEFREYADKVLDDSE